jgi:hypothetical protein
LQGRRSSWRCEAVERTHPEVRRGADVKGYVTGYSKHIPNSRASSPTDASPEPATCAQ